LFGVTIGGDRSLGTEFGADPMTIGALSGPTAVTALGGYFFLDNGAGGISSSGAMTVQAR